MRVIDAYELASTFGSVAPWRRSIVWALVLSSHAILGWAVIRAPITPRLGLETSEPLMVISVAPVIKQPISVNLAASVLPVQFVPIKQPAFDAVEVSHSAIPHSFGSGAIVPPRPLNEVAVDTAAFAKQAGLRDGVGATVVLRLEIKATGIVGRIEVDVSSGSAWIDQAAIEYVKALKWESGRIDDRSETIWIRYGVRLQSASGKPVALRPALPPLRSAGLRITSRPITSSGLTYAGLTAAA